MTYGEWIEENVLNPNRACAEKTLEMQEVFPELTRVRGHYVDPLLGARQHWWLVDKSGEIVDPTIAQFNRGGYYEPHDESLPEPTGKCPECGEYSYDGETFCCEECREEFHVYLHSFVCLGISMKAKTIKSILRRKVNLWADTITDENVRNLAKKNTIVTGGCIASMLLGEPVNDYDLYFRNRETAMAVASYYVETFKKRPNPKFKGGSNLEIYIDKEAVDRVKIVVKSAGAAAAEDKSEYQYFEGVAPDAAGEYIEQIAEVVDSKKKEQGVFLPVFITANAITLTDDVQLIFRFYGDIDEIHKNYDFVHCTCAWDSDSGDLRLPPAALESLWARELRYCGSKYPVCSVVRTRKFLRRGWSITAGQYVKMCFQIAELNLNDFSVLEEQLTGVDIHYFMEVLDLLKERDPARVDQSYLFELLDKVF